MKRIISRPEPDRLPLLPLPLYVRSVGYHEAKAGWGERIPAAGKKFVQIFWGVKGRGEFRMDGGNLILPPEHFIYHLPGEDHVHSAISDWCYHWFTLDGNMAAAFMSAYGYPREAMHSGPCPVELFLQLEEMMREMTPYSQRRMLSVAIDILARAGCRNEEINSSTRIVGKFIAMAQKDYADSGVNVNTLADRLGVHRTTLSRQFHQSMLIAPGEYLMQLRLQRALSLLRETNLPVCRVGEMVGIGHRAYFSRLIRNVTGMSPKAYRERCPSIQ